MTHSGDPTTTATVLNGGCDIKCDVLDGGGQMTSAGSKGSKGGTGRSAAKGGGGLSRSDSYRRARPLLSPAEARKVFRNSADVSSLDFSQCSLSATMTTEDDDEDRREERKEGAKNGGGFFRNLRSQFSFSSLRRKSPKKSLGAVGLSRTTMDDISAIAAANRSRDHSSGGDGTVGHPRMTSTPVTAGGVRPMTEPRMTSTPLSSCAESTVNGRLSAESSRTSPNALSCVSAEGARHQAEADGKWRSEVRSVGGGDLSAGVKFRTAALKNQYQRWSFAEQTLREGECTFFTEKDPTYNQ
jgi:hypothetical protein